MIFLWPFCWSKMSSGQVKSGQNGKFGKNWLKVEEIFGQLAIFSQKLATFFYKNGHENFEKLVKNGLKMAIFRHF